MMTQNTAGCDPHYLAMSFNDFLKKSKQPEETRSADEIISDISEKLDKLGGAS